ncbi:MAG: LD-carboxypeptidase [Desulfosarcinaceae bacterium]|nr:LD-carboxypeptidase [Desulfosarcinaceae bacterium]
MAKNAPTIAKLPPTLVPGDRIAVVAPAGPFNREKFDAGLAVLRGWGLEPVLGSHTAARKGYLAGEDGERAGDLRAFLTDPSLKAIIAARGGYGCLRLLPLIDAAVLDGPAKWLVGFSDITTLHHYLSQRAGWVTLHGPMVTTLATADGGSRRHLWSILSGAANRTLHFSLGEALLPGVAEGVVTGGNLTTLCHLLATPYQPKLADRLLFLEDVGEAPYRIDRMLTQMALAGCFEKLAGVVLGQFTGCGAWEEIRDLFRERLAPLGIPLAAGISAGHGSPNLALPFGLAATLDSDRHALTYHYPKDNGP